MPLECRCYCRQDWLLLQQFDCFNHLIYLRGLLRQPRLPQLCPELLSGGLLFDTYQRTKISKSSIAQPTGDVKWVAINMSFKAVELNMGRPGNQQSYSNQKILLHDSCFNRISVKSVHLWSSQLAANSGLTLMRCICMPESVSWFHSLMFRPILFCFLHFCVAHTERMH